MRADVPSIIVTVAAVVIACRGGHTPDTLARPAAPICDGAAAPEISSAIAIFPDLGTWIPDGEQVLDDNGYYFVYVDRNCRYWASRAPFSHGEFRTGVLSSADLAHFTNDLLFQRWWDWAGVWVPAAPVSDAPVAVLYPEFTREAAVICYGLCAGPPLPLELGTIYERVFPFIDGLWQAGASASGDVRFIARRWADGEGQANPVFDWPPTSFALADVAVPYSSSPQPAFGQGLLASGNDAMLLRELRGQYLVSWASSVSPSIEVRDAAGVRYSVFVRDTLPFEDENGLVRPP